ncbi:homeobox-leucine zipper protein HAT9-like [Dioscorea cayenensis subsp. rotundata]|uniref:Homeobox-leucine zipper protein HAT9-like n=1 Tax=Dioscorea cayennensis subsp. rotundata TaxID=55577 RepID=A0AB40ATI7_DIOCR|nr:homeobox-leucine zipper protein HAT9-like [Dioscorea cayenensis subsp. rotundata]
MSSLEPMLTLGLSGDPYGSPTMSKVFKESTQSPVSSFSNANPRSIKSEEIIGEETGTEKVSPRGSDDDEEVCAKKKLRLTKDQSALLEERFKEHTTLNPKQKQALAKQLNLRPRQVEVWFQNRRARYIYIYMCVCSFSFKTAAKIMDSSRNYQFVFVKSLRSL